MKTTLSLCLVTGVCALSALASADDKPPKPIVPPPPYASLPSATVTTPPKEKAPKSIPKTEKVEGFNVAEPPKEQLRDGKVTSVLIFAKPEDAKEFTAGKGFGFDGGADDTICYAQPSRHFRSDDALATAWPFEMEPTSRINAPYKPPPPRKKGEKAKPYTMSYGEMEVTAIHQERFFQEDKKARVESIDAWVDPNTHGVRLIARSSMNLERIGSAFNGVRLYAAKGDKTLHIIARREKPKGAGSPPTTSKDFRMMNAMRQPLMVEQPSGETDATQCGFARVTMKAEPGAAEIATFETTTVFVDPPEKKEEKPADADPEALGMREPREEDGPTFRVRPFRATVSSTWSSKDKEPVLSVSFGWVGREREM